MTNKEEYEFNVGDEGLGYDILDYTFTPSTKQFILSNIDLKGKRVLDIGCGAGVMTKWFSKQVGKEGKVLAIDNSQQQLDFAKRNIKEENCDNIDFKLVSAYELDKIGDTFDLVYCRFVMHHLHSPRLAVKQIYSVLDTGGCYICEEGIISSAYSYPPSIAWGELRQKIKQPEAEKDGVDRDGDIGLKMPYIMQQQGFKINNTKLVQPVLKTAKEKGMLLPGKVDFKDTELKQGKTEEQWQQEYDELKRIVNDEITTIGFYQSCQIIGEK